MKISSELGIAPEQARAIARLGALELSSMFDSIFRDEADQRKDFNLWMIAAQAKMLRAETLLGLPGILWELWNGQFFWVSESGRAWNPVPKVN